MLVRERHRDYFLTLAEEVRPKLSGPEQGRWLDVLEAEHDNLRVALTFCREETESGETGLRLGGALQTFWDVRGYMNEGREHLIALLSLPGAQPRSQARANALNGAGILAFNQNDFASAHSLYEESLQIRRELGDRWAMAGSLSNLGQVAAAQGDYASARALYEAALSLNRELGNRAWEATNLNNLGLLAKNQGDYASARSLYAQSLEIYRELGDRRHIAGSLGNLGNVACEQSDYTAARSLHEESLVIFRELGDKARIALSLEAFASLGLQAGSGEGVARLWSAASALREGIGFPMLSNALETQEREKVALRAVLGEAVFTAAWEEGRTMTMEQAMAYALGVTKT